MLRGRLMRGRGVEEEEFSWRGREVSRVEGFSDAVFAFAVTLLVVSLEVPRTFDELLETMRGFFGFAISFALLLVLWRDHYKFFGRYGLRDALIVWLNSALLFLVLAYVYPLKFLFTLLADQALGFESETIRVSQYPLLLMIYGAGFVSVSFLFLLFYWVAYTRRDALELNAHELSVTREEIQGFLINILVGLASITIAIVGGTAAVAWAGWSYVLLFPLQTINGRLMDARRKKVLPP